MIGRKELYPCGSGKKYKKSSIRKNQAIEFTRNRVMYAKGLYKNMEKKIHEYAMDSNLKNIREESSKKFYISQEHNSKIEKLYNEYFINDYRDYKNKTVIEKFSDENKLTFNKSQKNILSSIIKSNISMFNIEYIGSTKIIMKDYFTDDKITVQDIEPYKKLNVGENVICRLINIQSINILPYEYIKVSLENTKAILENIEKLYKAKNKEFKNIKEFINYNSEIIYKFAQQIILNDESYVVAELHINKTEEVSKSNQKVKSNVNIYDLLKNNIEDKYLQKGLDLWKKFVNANESIKGNENGWAAAVEYYIKKDAGETITQAQISQKYEISPRTLGKRYKELKAS